MLDVYFEALNSETIEQKKVYDIAGLLGTVCHIITWARCSYFAIKGKDTSSTVHVHKAFLKLLERLYKALIKFLENVFAEIYFTDNC